MKKFMLMVLVLVLSLGVLSGCTSDKTSPNVVSGDLDEVLGVVNGVNITREMIADNLKELEKTAVNNYINDYLLEEFFKDIDILDEELSLQVDIIKGQVGEGQWDEYLKYLGYSTEDEFKELVRLDMRKQKKKEAYKSEITVTEEQIIERYNSHKTDFQVLSGDMIFFDTEDEFVSASNMLKQPEVTLETLAESLGKEVHKNENVTFSFGGFTKPMDELEVGDLVATTKESGTFAVINVTKVSKTFEDAKSMVEEALKDEKAEESLNNELTAFYSKASIEILGEVIQ